MATTLRNIAIAAGKSAGKAMASWVFDGNTDLADYARILKYIQDGDLAVLDNLTTPNLFGEWADDPTPQTLADDLGIETDDNRLYDLYELWAGASHRAFWGELERTCRYHLS